MKYREILLEQLKSLPYFNKEAIYLLSDQYNLKKTTVDSYINRSLENKELLRLKNGTYVTADFFDKNKSDISYAFYLANVIRSPSYVSSWAALQYYDLATESIHSITSVTKKVTRNYQTKAGNFEYHSIKGGLFSGFTLVKRKFNFFIASPAKALFDLLYFKTEEFRGLNIGDVIGIVNGLRVDMDEMDPKERKTFDLLVRTYFKSNE